MRVLLFLSALLTALAGVAGPCAAARPVEASAVASVAVSRAPAVHATARRFVAAAYDTTPARLVALPMIQPIAAGRTGYIERRRE